MSTAKSHVTHAKAKPTEDAISLLTTDHAKVTKLFKEFESLKEDDGADTDVRVGCPDLQRAQGSCQDRRRYSTRRYARQSRTRTSWTKQSSNDAAAKELIAQLEDMSPDEELYDAKVIVLAEQSNT